MKSRGDLDVMNGSFWRSRRFSAMIAFIAVCLIVAGLIRGEARAVMMRAVQICFECIGIG